tara:strand:+ start:2215 stop:4236 length:2022 start_codon:yes stop_codon:yes gene_type:complete
MAFLSEKLISASGATEETDDDFNLVTGLYHFDGSNGAQNNTLLDSSPESHTVTRNADIVQGTFSPFSSDEGKWSVEFDGTDDYIDVASGATQLGSGDFTVEFWIKTTDTSFNLANPDDSTGSGYWGLLMQSGDLRWNDSYAVSNKWVVDGAALTDNQWHHVAIVRASGTFAVYYDGTSQSIQSGSFSDTTNYSGSDVLRIGKGYGAGALDEFQGFLSNFRTVIGTAVYTGNYTTPSTPLTAITNTKVLVCCSNRFRDKSTSAHVVTSSGAAIQPFSPFAPSASYNAAVNGGSGYFDGTGDYVSISTSDDFAFGTGDYTIECFFYKKSTGVQFIYEGRDNSDTSARVLFYVNESNKLSTYQNNSVKGSSSDDVPLNSWVHVALTRSSGTGYLFMNGAQVATWSSDTTNLLKPNNTLYIGHYQGGGTTYDWDGFISNLRVVKGTAVYTSAFTPSTSPLTAVTNTKLLLNFTNASIFDQTGKTNVDTVGNAQLDTSVKKFGTASVEFDGTGDYLQIPSSNFIPFGSGDFTVECFININSGTSSTGSSDAVIFECRASGATATGFVFNIRPNGTTNFKLNCYTDGAANLDGQTMNYGTWYHIAISRSGSTIRFFVDGTTTTNITKSNNFSDQPNVTIGASTLYSSSSITGFIDEFRITHKARYTSNFTAPTKEFPNL